MANKKLIEVALPLEKINAESAREKSIRHGHPSTLHLWWARRPLAAARAVIWASLVDDPSAHPDKYPTEEDQAKERERLFKILEDLVMWENSNNETVLEAARAEILKSTNEIPPALLDPFAGGGAIPLEAQRLGLEAHAHDLNPVAVMINKAMIEIPPKFAGQAPVNPEMQMQFGTSENEWKAATGMAEDVRYYGEWMKQEAFKRVGHLYPNVVVPPKMGGAEATVIAWIWSRTVASPDPTVKGAHVPLVSSLLLSKRKGNEAWVDIVCDEHEPDGWRFEVHTGKLEKYEIAPKSMGTKAGKGKDFVCCLTNSLIKRDYIQAEGKAGRLSQKLMAIVVEGPHGRMYLSPTKEHERIALDKNNYLDVDFARETFLDVATPTRAMITGGVCSAYGLKTLGHLFTDRQLHTLMLFGDLLKEVNKKVEEDAIHVGLDNDHVPLDANGRGAKAYGDAICIYLAFAIDKLADRGSSVCGWDSSREGLRNTFGRQAMPMMWDYAEGNPFCNASGCFDNMLEWVYKCIKELPATHEGTVVQCDAQSDCMLRNIMVSTDPPYYDNISYANLSDFFYVWMRRSLRTIYPSVFNIMLSPKNEELIATPYRHDGSAIKAKAFFEDGMLSTCRQIFKYAREDIPVTIYYAYKQSDSDSDGVASSGWETMLSSIVNAGFSITGTWPMRTEMANRAVASGTNALASSIVLVCRKRSENAQSTTRRNLISTLRRELRPALHKLQSSNIAPVDLAQSAIGPGMGVFSRYKQVLEADGSVMTVRSALKIINEEIDLYFNEQVGDLDAASRFCVDLYTQNAFNDIKYGEAEILANAKSTSIPMMASHGVVYAKAGIVHLIDRPDLSTSVDLCEKCIWLLTQQLTQAMATGGIEACANIIVELFGSNGEQAKDLAYRLYTIAERKNWAQEAYAYNALVVAWPDIQARAAALREIKPEQLDLFSFGLTDLE